MKAENETVAAASAAASRATKENMRKSRSKLYIKSEMKFKE